MRPPAVLVLVALPLASLGHLGPDALTFKRVFKADAKDTYTFKMGPHGEKTMVSCQYTETVTGLTPNGADAKFEIVKIDSPGLGASDAVPPLVSKVGWDNMPAAGSIRNGTEFVIFGSVAGITPNKAAKVGDSVTVKWENDAKDVKFEANGKLSSSDTAAKTLTVNWNIVMTPSYTTGGTFKLTSTYTLADFGLIKSEGTFTIGSTVMDIGVTHDTP